jgi:hypothetical protein
MPLILDSGAITWFAKDDRRRAAVLAQLRLRGAWPPVVLTPVLVECTTGSPKDARTNRFLKTCDVQSDIAPKHALRAAQLRTAAGKGSAVDALVVAAAEPDGVVVTSDPEDIGALASHASRVKTHSV